MADPIIHAVKFVDGSDSVIEGLAIPYGGSLGGKDLHGEDFGPDTDYALDWFPSEGRPTLYHHGLDEELKVSIVGRQIEREERPEGQWARVQLDKRNKYMTDIAQLVEDGALSFSSGAMPHLVRTRKDGHIERWPWVELSLTPTPANPDAAVYAVKVADAIEHLAFVRTEVPGPIKSLIGDVGSEHEPFAVHADRSVRLLDSLADRAEFRHEARAKTGRTLSVANRAEVEEVVAAIDAAAASLGERRERLTQLLSRTDPEAATAAKDAEREYLAWLHQQVFA